MEINAFTLLHTVTISKLLQPRTDKCSENMTHCLLYSVPLKFNVV